VAGSVPAGAPLAALGGPPFGPPFLVVGVAGIHPIPDQWDRSKHSQAFVAPLGHPQHAPFLGGGGLRTCRGPVGGAWGPPVWTALFSGRRGRHTSDPRPMGSVKTFTGVCGPFGAPPARSCSGRCGRLLHLGACSLCFRGLSVLVTVRGWSAAGFRGLRRRVVLAPSSWSSSWPRRPGSGRPASSSPVSVANAAPYVAFVVASPSLCPLPRGAGPSRANASEIVPVMVLLASFRSILADG